MKIRVNPIPSSVADGTDQRMRDAVEMLNNIYEGEEELKIPLKEFVTGLVAYIQRIKYMGSRGIVENLSALIECADTQVLRDTLHQWKDAEEMMWAVVYDTDNEEKD